MTINKQKLIENIQLKQKLYREKEEHLVGLCLEDLLTDIYSGELDD